MSLEQQISLSQFERTIFSGDVEKAEIILVALLLHAAKGEGFYGKGDVVGDVPVYSVKPIAPFNKQAKFDLNVQYYNRLASAITALFVHPAYNVSPKCMEIFLFNKFILVEIFNISSYRNMDHILSYRGIWTEQQELALKTENDLNLLLACYSVFSHVNLDFSVLFSDFPRHAVLTYMSSLACLRLTFDNKVAQTRDALLAQAELLQTVPLEMHPLEHYASTWMLCSYSDAEWKHDIKKTLNTVFAAYAQQNIPKKTQQQVAKYLQHPVQRSKPRMVIINEHFKKEHAMFRCFSRLMDVLRAEFELIFISPASEYDEEAHALFDQIVPIEDKLQSIAKAAETIADLAPDMVYYPSVGMNCLAIALANYRFAKIQVMGAGHPASSYSQVMDYLVLFGGGSFGQAALQQHCSEKLIVIPELSGTFAPRDFKETIQPILNKRPSVVNIAINSASFKVSPQLIEVCEALNKLSERPIRFHFFPNLRGMALDAYVVEINRKLPNAVVYQSMGYAEMMRHLNQCDFGLGTFPFGNTNSNVDAFMLGIPKVVMTSKAEIACVADEDVFKLVELPNWLCAENPAKFIAAALFLIHNDTARLEIAQKLLDIDYESRFFDVNAAPTQQFLDAMKRIATEQI